MTEQAGFGGDDELGVFDRGVDRVDGNRNGRVDGDLERSEKLSGDRVAADVGHLIWFDPNFVAARVDGVPESARRGEGVIDGERPARGSAAGQIRRGPFAVPIRSQHAHVEVVNRGHVNRHIVRKGDREAAVRRASDGYVVRRVQRRLRRRRVAHATQQTQTNIRVIAAEPQKASFSRRPCGRQLGQTGGRIARRHGEIVLIEQRQRYLARGIRRLRRRR